MILPEPGLIVSCYMHSMKHCTKDMIELLWDMDKVKTLRIEGVENLSLALKLKDIKDKYVIGLIKDTDAEKHGLPYITASINDVKRIEQYGADMVAIDSRIAKFNGRRLDELYKATTLPIMADVECCLDGERAWGNGASIIATTFTEKGFKLARYLSCKNMRVNVEGGLVTKYDVMEAVNTGAEWYTIGRGIHDIPTKIRYYLE